MTQEADNFLAHHGVLGMKWGKHKAKSAPTRTHSEDHKEHAALRKKKVSELSNAELKKLAARNELLTKHAKANPNTLKKGRNAVAAVLGAAGTATAIYNLINSKAGEAAIKVGKKAIEDALAGNGKHAVGYFVPLPKYIPKHL